MATIKKPKLSAAITSRTVGIPGGNSVTTGAHLPGGAGTPGVFTPKIPLPPTFKATTPTAATITAGGGTPPTPLPVDPIYDALAGTDGSIGRQYQSTVAGLGAQRKSTLLDYGYNEGADGALSFDAQNPFSRAAQLKLRYDQSRTGANNSYAARGQLYAGSLVNARDELNTGQARDENSLTKSLANFLSTNSSQQGEAATAKEFSLSQAESDRLGRAATNPAYSPAVPGAAATPAAAKSAASGDIVIRPSAAHNGKPWRFRKGSSGVLIPLGPA